MKRFVLYLCTLFVSLTTMAQQSGPGIQWQKCFGGSGDELLDIGNNYAGQAKLQLVSRDGAHLFIAGTTRSGDGDIGSTLGNSDIWVAKLDLAGTIIWRAHVSGDDWTVSGNYYEQIKSITETSDGSLLVLGTTYSSAGDNGNDALLAKLNPNGSLAWKKTYGGTMDDRANNIIETRNGNYAFVGYSESTDGALAGGSPSHEIWVGLLNTTGTIVWTKKFAGIDTTTAPPDVLQEDPADHGVLIKEDAEGNLVIGANVYNATSTNSNDWNHDIMVAGISSTGTLLWRKILASAGEDILYDLDLVVGGRLVLTGSTNGANGNFPGPVLSSFNPDAFILQLDKQANVTFFKRYGGNAYDDMRELVVMPDQTYLTIGITNSTDGYLAGDSTRYTDVWVANIATDGNVRWSKKYGGTDTDLGMSIAALADNSYIFLGQTWSNDVNVSGNHGIRDLWLVKLGGTSNLSGLVFFDANDNGIKDGPEATANNVAIHIDKPGVSRTVYTSFGSFNVDVDTGTYTVTVPLPYYTTPPRTKTFTAYSQKDTLMIPLKAIAGKQDLVADLVPAGPARPGFALTYKVNYHNEGTTTISNPIIGMVKDPRLTLVSTNPALTSTTTGDTLTWALPPLEPRMANAFVLNFTVAAPPEVNIGDTLHTYAFIRPTTGDLTPENNASRLNQVVVGSYDPNDKKENSGGFITQSQATSGQYLNYLIRFQNTGTDMAFNIAVRDTLDSKLDWSTLEMIAASHAYQLTITGGNKLHWQFKNIQLPDSNTYEPASHGYIAYKVKAKNTVVAGDQIHNDASIYFDYNLPVATNRFTTTILGEAADLVMTSSVSPTTAAVGTAVTASFSVTNSGLAAAEPSTVLFYQSADAVLTPGLNGDVSVFSYPVSTLAAGASTGTITRLLPIPCTQPAGTYYIFLVADGANVVAESDEANNTTSNSVNVQAVNVTVSPAAPSVCAGASATLTASGATSYSWSPATGLNATTGATVTATPPATTTYTVTGNANGCTATKTVTLTVNPVVTPAISIAYTGCPGTTLSFTATVAHGGTAPQVEWFVNNTASGTGNTFTLNNAANNTQVYARLTSNAACASSPTAISATETVSCITTSLPPIDGLEEVRVLPNPTKGALAVRLKLSTVKAVSFRVVDAHGREVVRTTPQRLAGTATRTLDLAKAPAGVYYLQVQVGGDTFTEKIVRVN